MDRPSQQSSWGRVGGLTAHSRQKILEELMGGVSQMPMKRNPATQELTDAMCAWVMQWAMSGGVLPTEGREVTFGYVSPFAEDRAKSAGAAA